MEAKDINQLYLLRYFINDLIENLAQEHKKTILSNKENFIVYQSMKLSKKEFNYLKENQGKLMLNKGFLLANHHYSIHSDEKNDLIDVLFQIECNVNELDDSLIFADITEFHEKQILFDLNTTFRLESIEQISTIKLKTVNDGKTILQKYINDTHKQIEDLTIPIIFGKSLYDMNQWNQSQIYFEHLAWIEHSIGQAHQWKGEWNEARKYYDNAHNRMIQNEPIRIKDSAIVLSDIGEVLYLQGKYEEPYDFHRQTLEIRKKYYSSNHPHIATSLENIGLINEMRLKKDEAFDFYKRALSIREEYYNNFHVDVAKSLISCGNTIEH